MRNEVDGEQEAKYPDAGCRPSGQNDHPRQHGETSGQDHDPAVFAPIPEGHEDANDPRAEQKQAERERKNQCT